MSVGLRIQSDPVILPESSFQFSLDPDPDLTDPDLDPVCLERLDPDLFNIRPDPNPFVSLSSFSKGPESYTSNAPALGTLECELKRKVTYS